MSGASMKYVALILVPSDVQKSYRFISNKEFENQMQRERINPIYEVEFIYPPAEPRQQNLKLQLNLYSFQSKFTSLHNKLVGSGVVGVIPSLPAEDCTDLNPTSTYNTKDKDLIKQTVDRIRETMWKIEYFRSFSGMGLQDGRSLSFYNFDPRNCVIHLVPLSMASSYQPNLQVYRKGSRDLIASLHHKAREEQKQQEKKEEEDKKRNASSDEDDDDDSGFFSAYQVIEQSKRQRAEKAVSSKAGDESKDLPRPEAAEATSSDNEVGAPRLKKIYCRSNEMFEARARVAPMFREGHLGNDL